MEIPSLSLVLAATVGTAGVAWLFAAGKLRGAAAQATLLRDSLSKTEMDLAAARHEANFWRTQAENDGRARVAAEASASRVGGLETDCDELRKRLTESAATVARLEAKLAEQEQGHREKIEALAAIRGEIERDLKNIANDSLRANQTTFLELANQVLDKHKESAAADLDARKLAVEALVSPIQDAIRACQTNLAELKDAGSQSYGAVSAELKSVVEAQNAVRDETARLVNALRAAPKTRGRWGENTLRNVLELAGLSSYCDFATEQSFAREELIVRPDVVIRLPGGRSIIVDAKTSMAAYLDAVDAADEAERERYLVLHAQQLRTQVKLLAGKSYWDGLAPTPDYVVMFVPGENFYAAAAERDPQLFEFAAAQRVLIVTPATLIALAKAVAYGWRQEKVAENAKRVHELGRDLYKRLSVMGEHIIGLGKGLAGSVRKYNDFIGSLEGAVMPQARRFHELEVEGTSNELLLLMPVEIEPRQLRHNRDIPAAALHYDPASEAAC
jgi:DNA recombination protein RmuC